MMLSLFHELEPNPQWIGLIGGDGPAREKNYRANKTTCWVVYDSKWALKKCEIFYDSGSDLAGVEIRDESDSQSQFRTSAREWTEEGWLKNIGKSDSHKVQ